MGIDQAILSTGINNAPGGKDGTVAVRELAGGCLCCALSTVTSAALVQLLRTTKPDRLIIEPSGLAHPKALLDLLQSEHLRTSLAVKPIICLVDLSTFSFPSNRQQEERTDGDDSSNFQGAVAVSHIVIGTKLDICSDEQVDGFIKWAKALQPKKMKVLACSNSQVDQDSLGILPRETFPPPPTDNDNEDAPPVVSSLAVQEGKVDVLGKEMKKKVWLTNAAEGIDDDVDDEQPTPGNPVRKESSSSTSSTSTSSTSTCGWIFHSDDIFDAAAVQSFAESAWPFILRLKGVVRVQQEPPKWSLVSIGARGADLTTKAAAAVDGTATSENMTKKNNNNNNNSEKVLLQELEGHQDSKDSRLEIIVGATLAVQNSSGESEVGEALTRRDWQKIETLLLKLFLK